MDWNPAEDQPVGVMTAGGLMVPMGGDATPNAKVFVGNLAWAVTSEQLQTTLAQAGELLMCEVQYAGEGRTHSKGFGLATFADAAGAAKAIQDLNDVELEGRRIFLREDRPPASRQKVPRAPRDGGARVSGPPPERPPAAPSLNLFCGNLPFSTTTDELTTMFASFSVTSAEVKIGRNLQSRGFGIVTCASVEDATSAIAALHGTNVGERALTVRFDSGPPPRN